MFAVTLLELTLRSMINDIPRDAASIFVYILLLSIVGVVIYGSRGGSGSAEGREGESRSPGAGRKADSGRRRGG